MYTLSKPDIPATKKQCMSCTESKKPNSIYSWWVKNPIESYSGEGKISLCRVTAENMSPHTTYFNTLGSSRYAFCALQIWNTVFLYFT
jgi:hypothetical protein